jgi:hypothetical protein
MVELGLVSPFHDFSGEQTICLTRNCFSSYTGDCCFNVIYGLPKGEECPAPTCEPGDCKACKMQANAGYLADLYMDK